MQYGPKQLARKLFTGKVDVSYQTLQKWNLALVLLYGLEAAAILLFSQPRNYPINISFMSLDTLQSKVQGATVTAPAIHPLGGVNLTYIVAALFVTAAIVHLFSATIGRSYYEEDIKRRKSVIRAIQFTVEALLVLTALALMAGVYDIGTLGMVLVFAVSASLLIYLGSLKNGTDKGRLSSGMVYRSTVALVCVVPFVLIAGYLVAGHLFGGGAPGYSLIWIYLVALFVLGLLALNRWLLAQKKGKWSNYPYGERCYMGLNIIALTLVGWGIFASVLHP